MHAPHSAAGPGSSSQALVGAAARPATCAGRANRVVDNRGLGREARPRSLPYVSTASGGFAGMAPAVAVKLGTCDVAARLKAHSQEEHAFDSSLSGWLVGCSVEQEVRVASSLRRTSPDLVQDYGELCPSSQGRLVAAQS